jgi:hypothetical protein
MTATTERRGFFNPDPAWLPPNEEGIPRDGKERPLIVPPGGDEPVPYERISRVANATDNLEWLMDWRIGHAVLGMARNPDLCWQAAAFDDWNDPRMRDLAETAHDRAGGNLKANYGTAMHAHTDPGADPERIPEVMRDDAAAYHLALRQAGLEIVEHEVFVVDDLLQVAGTLDAIGMHEELGLVALDKKTGHMKAMPFGIQLACYANGRKVDLDLVRRGLFSPRTDMGLNLERAVVAHIPKEKAICTLKKVDIQRGYEAAQRAMEVMADQQCAEWIDPEPLGRVTRKDLILDAIAGATCRADLRALLGNAERFMTKAMRETANKRWMELKP